MLRGTLRQEGTDAPATSENVVAALSGTSFFWLDLEDTAGDAEVQELLRVHFGFHPLAVQASERFAAATALRRLRRFRIPRGPRRRPGTQREGRGALFLERPLRGDAAPCRLHGDPPGARAPGASPRGAAGDIAADRDRVPGDRGARGQLLPGASPPSTTVSTPSRTRFSRDRRRHSWGSCSR